MAKRVTYRWQVFDFIATAGFIVFGVGLLLAASPRLQIVQAQPTTAAQPDSPLAGTDLAVVSVEVKDKTIQFGDALDIVVTLQNQGKEPSIIPADALILKNE